MWNEYWTSSDDKGETLIFLNNNLRRLESFQFVYCRFEWSNVQQFTYEANSLIVIEGGDGINIQITDLSVYYPCYGSNASSPSPFQMIDVKLSNRQIINFVQTSDKSISL